jgi:L-serine dehydratase
MRQIPFISIFNDILGPVMRGPSSSHTAGSYHIARTVRSLLGEFPASASFTFDPAGSYARTFREQNADKAFAAGLLEWPLTDGRFPRALALASQNSLRISFAVAPLSGADHPNFVRIELFGASGKRLTAAAKSTGGGGFLISEVDGQKTSIDGKTYQVLIDLKSSALPEVKKAVRRLGLEPIMVTIKEQKSRITVPCSSAPPSGIRGALDSLGGIRRVYLAEPVYYLARGRTLFEDGAGMLKFAKGHGWTLGQAAARYESELLGLSDRQTLEEILSRFEIMKSSVRRGLKDRNVRMKLLGPSARRIIEAEHGGRVAIGGIHTRAAARALAALHFSNSGGIVCAAPTGGSAGVIPGVIVTLAEEKRLTPHQIALALFAAGAVGLVIARRATFAAEIAGCQVEIGAAGAMAAAAVVESARGSAHQAMDAAAISLQNTMGSVCDLVQGMCEIPCHTRNAAAASSAFLSADLILGGYKNPIPLDETVDASLASGKMLPPELRVTSLGGLAVTPSARSLKRRS